MSLRLTILFGLIFFFSCNKDFQSEKDTPIGVFNAMWKFIDENYVFIDLKSLDMAALKETYSSQISESTSDEDLFTILSNLLFELKDGHCFLDNGDATVRFDTSEGLSSPFSIEVIKENYFQDNIGDYQFISTGIINDSIGYIYLSDFENTEDIRQAINDLNTSNIEKIIFDIRDNSGGDPQAALTIASSFLSENILLGQMVHKNGKAHNDFTEPIDIFSEGSEGGGLSKKVRLLTNRNSFSASSYLAGMLQHIDHVEIIGETTGGGGGDAVSLELPNTWVVAVTINYFLDAMGNHIENGVEPDIFISNTLEQLDLGIDDILEEAIKR